MKVAILVACFVAASLGNPVNEWDQFKANYNKIYTNGDEDETRMRIYFDNKKLIEEHNRKYYNGQVSYKLAMNHLGDMTNHELMARPYGSRMPGFSTNGKSFIIPSNLTVPASVDWRSKGAVTPIKDYGQCMASWAFSTTGAMEGWHFLKTGNLVSLSEQNLIDCSIPSGYNTGCNGGYNNQALQYIVDNGGIDTEISYPYRGTDGPCMFNKNTVGATLAGYADIPSGDENGLQAAVATLGPIPVVIDAGQSSFQFYSSGVYDDSGCSSQIVDWGVLVVGYGTENGKDYWLVKNSWGTSWGDKGYIKMSRNKNNQCGIASRACYPTV